MNDEAILKIEIEDDNTTRCTTIWIGCVAVFIGLLVGIICLAVQAHQLCTRLDRAEMSILDWQYHLRDVQEASWKLEDRVKVLEAERYTIEVKAIDEETDPFQEMVKP